MIRQPRRDRRLAITLAALAGYVDATGFLSLGGFFVSFMSGNSTRLAVGLAHDRAEAAVAGALVAAFVGGVILGTLAGHLGRSRRAGAVLALVAVLLALAAGLDRMETRAPAILAATLAMGAVNATFAEGGEVRIGLTYMTGTLVRIGQRVTAALLGGERWGWLPDLLLWSGLVAGATAGAALYPRLGLDNLWIAFAMAAVLAVRTAAGQRPLTPPR